jgi:cytoskeleton-associated protein 5
MSQEDAEARAPDILPSDVLTNLEESAWKLRLEAIDNLFNWLEGGEVENVESEIVIRYLRKKPGWKESNFQVFNKMISIFQLISEKSPNFSKASSSLIIPALVDKLGDIKCKKSAGDAMEAMSEKWSLGFVLSQGL